LSDSVTDLDPATLDLLRPSNLPRSNRYPLDWLVLNAMGPNPVWLVELLAGVLDLRPGQRVLDLGCGRAASSIFLAREFQLTVWAADLWISPTDNWSRIQEAGLGDRVLPIRAEAHQLPFADGYFDAIVSIDAYHYFGTDGLCLDRIARLLRPGGVLAITVPGLRRELNGERPPHLVSTFGGGDLATLHTPAWWRAHWEITGLVEVERADSVPDAHALWQRWDAGCLAYGRSTGIWPQGPGGNVAPPPGRLELLEVDREHGEFLDLVRIVARRPR
jgi:cyclopropane fatty-acyl-phospholipid synthase-like methyltransferase